MSDLSYITSTIDRTEKKAYLVFLSAIKTRKGMENAISIENALSGFEAKGYRLTHDMLKKFAYNAVVRGGVLLIFTGSSFFCETDEGNLHAYINQLWQWADGCDRPDLKELLYSTARSINKNMHGEE